MILQHRIFGNMGVLLLLIAGLSSCGTEAPVLERETTASTSQTSGQNNTTAQPSNDSGLQSDNEPTETPTEENTEQGTDDDEEVVEQGPSPEEQAALALRQQGKVIYDGMCLACHGEPAATTLNSRDAAQIAGQAGSFVHNSLDQATFPNVDQAAAVIAYLVEPI